MILLLQLNLFGIHIYTCHDPGPGPGPCPVGIKGKDRESQNTHWHNTLEKIN